MCNQVVEVCTPGLNQECLGLRWEGVHKISVTFITVNNILSGVVRVLLVVFFFSTLEFPFKYLVMVLPEKLWELARVQVH